MVTDLRTSTSTRIKQIGWLTRVFITLQTFTQLIYVRYKICEREGPKLIIDNYLNLLKYEQNV